MVRTPGGNGADVIGEGLCHFCGKREFVHWGGRGGMVDELDARAWCPLTWCTRRSRSSGTLARASNGCWLARCLL